MPWYSYVVEIESLAGDVGAIAEGLSGITGRGALNQELAIEACVAESRALSV